jgi:serralysin
MAQIIILADTGTFGSDILRGKIQTDNHGGTTTLNNPDNFIYDYIYNYGDTIYGKSGHDVIIGDRYDTQTQDTGYDRLYGEDGNDIIYGDTGPENLNFRTLATGSGNVLVGGLGKDTIHGGTGTSGDYIFGGLELSTPGTPDDGADVLFGYGGNDYIYGGGGNDIIDGGADNDGNLRGGIGNDTIRGGLGNDYMYGGAGSDTFVSQNFVSVDDGDDYYDGDGDSVSHNNEIDTLSYVKLPFYVTVDLSNTSGQATNAGGFDTIRNMEKLIGTNFGDRLTGSDANEIIEGRKGADKVVGGQGNDRLDGGRANDSVYGGTGNDVVKGGAGADRIYGEAGRDKLYGGTGKDVMSGGAGKDAFYFSDALVSANVDVITDFRVVDDTIWLKKTLFAGLGAAVTAGEFHIGSAAADRGDRLIYNSNTGKLFYDADGNKPGGIAAVHFATLKTGLKMTADDFDLF